MKVYKQEDWNGNWRIKVLIQTSRDAKTLVEPMHMHEFTELSYVLSGEAVEIINGTTYAVQKGDIVWLRPGDAHTLRSKAGFELMNCLFENDVFAEFVRELETVFHISMVYIPNMVRLTGKNLMDVDGYFQEIRREYAAQETGSDLGIKYLLNLIFIRIIRHIQTHHNMESLSNVSGKILEYIEQHLNVIDLQTIAAHFGYSPSYFSKFFKKTFGVGLTTYINSIKVHRAQDWILSSNGELAVEELCNRFGFRDRKHFCSIYKEYLGITPSAALKLQRQTVRMTEKQNG